MKHNPLYIDASTPCDNCNPDQVEFCKSGFDCRGYRRWSDLLRVAPEDMCADLKMIHPQRKTA